MQAAYVTGLGAAVRLGQLLGARLALFCRFNTVLGEESLNADLVDVETTNAIPLPELPLSGDIELTAWMETLANDIVSAIQQTYPLRGIVREDNGALSINLGSDHGLTAGARLTLMSGPGLEYTLPDTYVIVREPVGAQSAPVEIEGPVMAVPAGGWYAEVSGDA